MATTARKADKNVRDELYKAFEDVVKKAMMPGIPVPQRQALHNRAQELRAQWIELEAARFNRDLAKFKTVQQKVSDAVGDLRKSVKEIDDAIKIAEKAGKVFGLVDKLLKTAIKFAPIVL